MYFESSAICGITTLIACSFLFFSFYLINRCYRYIKCVSSHHNCIIRLCSKI
nr:MAG TPA: hypothetical protein [Caudoviricetes sp.]DAM00208.1 MAG TPA: hypothetical protein [Caudoviricetes sp.]